MHKLHAVLLLIAAMLLAACAGAEPATVGDGVADAATPEPVDEGDAGADGGGVEADGAASRPEAAGGELHIGAVLDITGPGAVIGSPQRDTLQRLVEDLNAEGGIEGVPVELTILDNRSTEAGAASAVTQLVEGEAVDVIIGPSRTGPGLAMRPIAESSGIPMISLAGSRTVVDGSEWVFMTPQDSSIVIERLTAHIQDQGWSRVGLVRDSSGFGEGVAEALEAAEGIEVVIEERFSPEDTDFTAQMIALRGADTDVNLIWGSAGAAAGATRAYRELGIDTPLLQSHGIANQAFLDAAGSAADGSVFAGQRLLVADQLPADDELRELASGFVAWYQDAFGELPSPFAGYAFDAFNMVVETYRAVGDDPTAFRDHLESLDGFPGVSGSFTYGPDDHAGLTADALVLIRIDDGDWVLVEGGA